MEDSRLLNYLKDVLNNQPSDWLNLTTHRLDIYEEKLAKTQFLDEFESLFSKNNSSREALYNLPTAYDYIRLGHPLSSILEWAIAKFNEMTPEKVICFSSRTMPVMAVLRKNKLENRRTRVLYINELPTHFDAQVIQDVYGYSFDLVKIERVQDLEDFDGTTVLISKQHSIGKVDLSPKVDFYVYGYGHLGSVLLMNGEDQMGYIAEIQHVRRRETIAMTPANSLYALEMLIGKVTWKEQKAGIEKTKESVRHSIQSITGSKSKALVASSGLSIQYAIVMGLVDHALENHKGNKIHIIVPPNCYGGTNDQARRVAACVDNVEVVDLPVDGDNNMVQSIDIVLEKAAKENAVPYIIAEIPTNPRVEVPDLHKLREVLSAERKTGSGKEAIAPVFILDQTFCPNVHFLRDEDILASVRTISYVSGSKFPSGGKSTAGYCVANKMAEGLMPKIEKHLLLCDNEATDLQYEILSKQLPSMNQRIRDAYVNTREFVNFIREVLPAAKINFVSEELAEQGFTPSVFSLDLPTKGNTEEERELYKRELNHKLIGMMISEIPEESKYCVSYGQLKGCYWTIPATSTQGTTKEGDKDYIARVALSPDLDLERHKKVFLDFVGAIES